MKIKMTVDDEGGILFGDYEQVTLESEVYLADYEIELESGVYIPSDSLKKYAYETLIRRLKLRRE